MHKRKIDLNNKTILITGAAGFIGAHLAKRLLKELSGSIIVGLDNLNSYYDVRLKEYRLQDLGEHAKKSDCTWKFEKQDVADQKSLRELFGKWKFDIVVHLAAQAGVRYSVDHPDAYIESNVVGFYNILEACRYFPVEHLVYASSSSVYGRRETVPFSVEDRTDAPVSLYAATKKTNELFAGVYAGLYGIPCTGLRFFTVYGPAGRPDMFYYAASEKLIAGKEIQLFNNGNCKRDYTYIEDIVRGIILVMSGAPEKKEGVEPDGVPSAVYNIGSGKPIDLMDFVEVLKEELQNIGLLSEKQASDARIRVVGMQPGDVAVTFSDSEALQKDYGFRPGTDFRTGIRAFAEWYAKYAYGG